MNIRLKALQRAQHYIGVHEVPDNTNRGPIIDTWQRRTTGGVGFPWCAAFLWCMFDDVGRSLGIQFKASVASWVDWAKAGGYEVKRPFKGDVVCYSWDGPTPRPDDHIGIIEKVLALPSKRTAYRHYIRAVEGNAGNAVRRKWRLVKPSDVVYIRVPS